MRDFKPATIFNIPKNTQPNCFELLSNDFLMIRRSEPFHPRWSEIFFPLSMRKLSMSHCPKLTTSANLGICHNRNPIQLGDGRQLSLLRRTDQPTVRPDMNGKLSFWKLSVKKIVKFNIYVLSGETLSSQAYPSVPNGGSSSLALIFVFEFYITDFPPWSLETKRYTLVPPSQPYC